MDKDLKTFYVVLACSLDDETNAEAEVADNPDQNKEQLVGAVGGRWDNIRIRTVFAPII